MKRTIKLGDYELTVENIRRPDCSYESELEAERNFFLDLAIWLSEAEQYNREHHYSGCARTAYKAWHDVQSVKDAIDEEVKAEQEEVFEDAPEWVAIGFTD